MAETATPPQRHDKYFECGAPLYPFTFYGGVVGADIQIDIYEADQWLVYVDDTVSYDGSMGRFPPMAQVVTTQAEALELISRLLEACNDGDSVADLRSLIVVTEDIARRAQKLPA